MIVRYSYEYFSHLRENGYAGGGSCSYHLNKGLNKGVTFAHFPLFGKTPVVKEQLKILDTGMQMRSALSRISLTDILSKPIALYLLSLFRIVST